ncbi:MAG: polymer-forming cytoskeletal protein [Campylobacterota bacterium]|nr:polymer-forming cytoskeletal protein [Campylobacterota bacterium]
MAIFNNSTNDIAPVSNDTTTIITEGAVIKGDMTLTCNLYVDGKFEGTIDSQKEINVGKSGHIKGEIKVDRLIVKGFVEGNIEADRVEIKAQGHLLGSVISSELVIESKGVFEGDSKIKSNELPKKVQQAPILTDKK